MEKILGFFFTGCCLAVVPGMLVAAEAQSALYSQAQSERGAAVYTANCASCHASDLRGNSNSPGLVGVGFQFLWQGRPLSEFYNKMRSNMPTNNPASLPEQSYIDLLAFILQQNDYPSGPEELEAATIEDDSNRF